MKLPRNSQIWGPPYAWQRFVRILLPPPPPKNIWVTMADHFEPMWLRPDFRTAQSRVDLWHHKWPAIADRCRRDSVGNPPRYTFFYPEEEYHPRFIESLAEMVRFGIADVEVHLHHDGEGRAEFIHRVRVFCARLHEHHGLLRYRQKKLAFGFIHGNWALDNSRADGRWCGLNDEIGILRDLGCYADFTMPSGDSSTQARLINTIYYCTDDPDRPKSYDSGAPVSCGGNARGDLLMIPGPLGIRWKDRWLPRLETGEVAAGNIATPYRVRRWIDLAPRIGTDVFLKLYTHGAQEANSAVLLQDGLETAFNLLLQEAERRSCKLFFVSAWQMYLAIEAVCSEQDALAMLDGTNALELHARY